MKNLLSYIVCLLLIAMTFSCGETHYDSRLTAIDSIIEDRPDSALVELRALDYESLSGSDNRAYYALLLTQGRYKCYDSIPSTDTIEIAVAQFTSNGDREKLTRSLIFKGAVLEGLGNPTAAMLLYKQAEETACPTDYYNLGYANLRIAELYNNAISVDSIDFSKYKIALDYFNKCHNAKYQLVCNSAIGVLYRYIDDDSAFLYLNRTKEMAKQMQNDYYFYNTVSKLAQLFYKMGCYEDARCFAVEAMSHHELLDDDCSVYVAIDAYAKLGQIDSAKVLKDMIVEPHDRRDKVAYYSCLSELGSVEGNSSICNLYALKASELSGELLIESLQSQLKRAEADYNKQSVALQLAEAHSDNVILCLLLAVAIIIILSVSIIVVVNRLKIKSQENMIHSLRIDLQNLLEIKSEIDDKSNYIVSLNRKIESLISAIRDLTTTKNTSSKIENASFDKIKEKLITRISSNEDFWISLIEILNRKYNGVISRIERENILLSSDIKIICLVGFGFSNASIAMLADYSNAHSVSNRKRVIAEKLHLKESLSEIFEI